MGATPRPGRRAGPGDSDYLDSALLAVFAGGCSSDSTTFASDDLDALSTPSSSVLVVVTEPSLFTVVFTAIRAR